ncbi:MAG: 30S ribosomal protein S1 [Alphaproteobacteria bacterium]|nr:30S ribosomal protein S1 [Alphaproteobacteria bacterium]
MTEENSKQSFAELFEESCKTSVWEGKVLKGIVVSVDDNFVTIDVGLKSEGRIPTSEFTAGGKSLELKAGDSIDVFIDRYEDKSGEIVLSRDKALREAAWEDFEKCFKEGTSVMGTIFSRVKGGFMVDLNGATAFLPGSQVDVRPVKDVTPLMGVSQPFLILKMDRVRDNIVVSRKGILEGANAEEREKVIASLEEGKIIEGIVKNITTYGAFVDIGGIDGLLHNADIAWKRINHPSEVVSIGQKVQVMVIKFNKETKRISLGMKQLTRDPWEGVDTEFVVGSRVSGKVTNVTEYGIFVELKEGVEGLVYVSEISWKKNISPTKVANPGDIIDVIVLDVDVAKRRMGLGIKQLQDNPWNKLVKDFPVGQIFEGEITNVTDFGIFVSMCDDIDGMVHLNDISWEKAKEEDLAKFHKGDKITVKVLEIEPERERISLGIKQLTECPYGDADIELKRGTVVTCIISEIKDNDGIEVILSNGSLGFIKNADLAKDRQDRRTDRFAVGEKVDAKILSIDKNTKKVSLSIKSLEIEKEKKAMEEFGSSDSGASLGDILGLAIGKTQDKE